MKNKLRLKTNIKHTKLIKDVKKSSWLIKYEVLSIKDYLKTNRYYFGINIG